MDSQQKQETCNRVSRSDVAIFSGKCFMLNMLLDDTCEPRVPVDLQDEVVNSMFNQSKAVLGIQ